MKTLITSLLFVLLHFSSNAQESFRRLLLIEPSHANGFFILDQNKMHQEGVSTVDVLVLVDKILPNGQIERRTLDQFTIDNGHYWRIDPLIENGLTQNETIHYKLLGLNQAGDIVIDIAQINDGGWAWPPVCYVSCNSATYAWTLKGYSNGSLSYIDLLNGHDAEGPFDFYVPETLWPEFINSPGLSSPSFFSLPGQWDDLIWTAHNPNQFQPSWEFIPVEELIGTEPMLNGFPVGASHAGQLGYGIRKDRGPWKSLSAST